MEKKSFGLAFVLWFVLGGIGAHRVYVQEKVSVLFWYWIAIIFTLTIILWVDLFRLKSMIEKENEIREMKDHYRKTNLG